MDTKDEQDAMLFKKIIALREGVRAGSLDPLWVEFVLQCVIENNHNADFALRPVWITLKRPKRSELSWLLKRTERDEGRLNGKLEKPIRQLIETIDLAEGPDTVDVTLVTKKTLFIPWHTTETEELVRSTATSLGLEECPRWVPVALILHTERTSAEQKRVRNIHFCLQGEKSHRLGIGADYGDTWRLYGWQLATSWSGNINWAFVKPRR
jgi:hypothetical protein